MIFAAYGEKNFFNLKELLYILSFFTCGFGYSQINTTDSLMYEELSAKDSTLFKEAFEQVNLIQNTTSGSADWNWDGVSDIRLEEVTIVAPFKFENRKDRLEYLILKRKTEKVWPYAVLAAERLNTLQTRLDSLDSKYAKKEYTKRVQRYMEDQFTADLKKLTKTEGQILVKLMYRQTGVTTYETIKDLRSGFRAFRYNLTAGLFTISLKEKFNPMDNREDFYIEHILRMGFQRSYLKEQAPRIDIDLANVLEKWEKKTK